MIVISHKPKYRVALYIKMKEAMVISNRGEQSKRRSYRNVVVGPAVEELDLVGELLLNLSVDFRGGGHSCERNRV